MVGGDVCLFNNWPLTRAFIFKFIAPADRYRYVEQPVDACARAYIRARPRSSRARPRLQPPRLVCLHRTCCVSSPNHASPAPSPTASASAHRLKVLEQPEAVGRVGLGSALDGEEVEAVGGLLALLEELCLELLLRVLYPRQQVPAEPKRAAARKRMAYGGGGDQAGKAAQAGRAAPEPPWPSCP